jgi:head-tail adaptor
MLSAKDIKTIRATQVTSLPDTCYIQALTQATNSYGEITESWADSGAAIACGLEMQPGSEIRKSDKTVLTYDAILRVAITELPTEAKRIRVTKRHNESITAIIYNIASPIQRGASGNRILLNKVNV